MSVFTTTRRVNCLEAFKLLGAKISARGVAEADAMVRTGTVTHKRYKVRRRASDGHTVYRWGRLVGADVISYDDGKGEDFIIVFVPDIFDGPCRGI